MSAKSVEGIGVDGESRALQNAVLLWSLCAICMFAGALLCLIAGLLAAAAAAVGVVAESPVTARWTLAVLFAALVLMFAGAHSLDKLDALRRTHTSR